LRRSGHAGGRGGREGLSRQEGLCPVNARRVSIYNYDAASAIKITIPRPVISVDINDTAVSGGRQYGPLVDLDVP